MATPRSQQINLESTPYYHCMTRCVRRAYLCGKDNTTGKDYNHRKAWLVSRMKTLADIFAINIAAYAVMSNHYHLVLHVDEQAANQWSDAEVRGRWTALFPLDAQKLENMEKSGLPKEKVQEKIDIWRDRLINISWFMRCLNEKIAKLSNEEDEMTGRFWDGRFKSQSLLDEAALLSAMVYVDLNPIRADVNATPETSKFTSIYDRIKAIKNQRVKLKESKKSTKTTLANNVAALCSNKTHKQPQHLLPIKCINENDIDNPEQAINFNLSDYLELVEFTGRHIRNDKKGYISDALKPILERLNISEPGWIRLATGIESTFIYAVGSKEQLEDFNKNNRRRKLRGISIARSCYL